jgi:hypothetical protein
VIPALPGHSNFRRRVWLPGLAAVGLEGVHLHDLRHTGNKLTAYAGANPKELMARMGHDSERAALIYLHSSRERQRTLADAVGEAARAELANREWQMTRAPTATRTRDLPLRRRSLYPLSYQGLQGFHLTRDPGGALPQREAIDVR